MELDQQPLAALELLVEVAGRDPGAGAESLDRGAAVARRAELVEGRVEQLARAARPVADRRSCSRRRVPGLPSPTVSSKSGQTTCQISSRPVRLPRARVVRRLTSSAKERERDARPAPRAPALAARRGLAATARRRVSARRERRSAEGCARSRPAGPSPARSARGRTSSMSRPGSAPTRLRCSSACTASAAPAGRTSCSRAGAASPTARSSSPPTRTARPNLQTAPGIRTRPRAPTSASSAASSPTSRRAGASIPPGSTSTAGRTAR